jgi:methyl-accepting chemotaxis protein
VSKAKPVTTHAIEAIDIDLDGALQKHVEWKVKLRSAISNKETLDAATISKDNCCDFGKWLHSEESHSKIAHLPSYQTCMSKHAEFHVAAGKVAEVINAKQYEQADKMLENGSDFVNSSSAVATAIMKLKKDTAAKPVTVAKAVKPKEPEVELFSDDWEEF